MKKNILIKFIKCIIKQINYKNFDNILAFINNLDGFEKISWVLDNAGFFFIYLRYNIKEPRFKTLNYSYG